MLGLTAAAASVAANTAVAAEWTVEPGAQLTTQAQNNARMSADGGDTETSIGAQAGVQMARRTERLELTSSTRVYFQRYQHDTGLDRNDQQLDLALHWNGEHLSWTGTAAATRDTTLTSELGTTALTQSNRRHESYDFSLGPSWNMSERLSMGSSVGLQINRYPGPSPGLTDYRFGTANLNAGYQLSDRASVSLVGSAGHFSSGNSSTSTDNASVRLQAQYAWAELWTLNGGAGPSWIEANHRRQQGVVYSASVSRRLELSSLSLSASRSQSPSGFGILTNTDDVKLSFSTQIRERLTGSLSAGLTRRRDALPALGLELPEVRYRQIDASLAWQVAPSWGLVLGANNRAQRAATLSGSALANSYEALLTLNWTGSSHVF